MLKDNFVDIYKIEEGLKVEEVIKKYQAGQIQPIAAPTHSIDESESATA